MPTRLIQPKVAIEDEGFVVLRNFIGADELASARAAVDRRLELPFHQSCVRPNNTLVPLRWNDPLIRMVIENEERSKALKESTQASDLRWISGYISIKDPHSAALWWHQDWWCWDHPVSFRRAPAQVAVLCYLAETSASNGGLRVIPGSHKKAHPIGASLVEAHSTATQTLPDDHIAMSDHPDQVAFSLGAGDAVVIDYRLLHGTHPNSTSIRRDCLLLSFAPGWRELPEEVRGHIIQHPAQPTADERKGAIGRMDDILPSYDGPLSDLPVNRMPPPEFTLV